MTITSKGQVTVPQNIRKKYRLEPNTEVEFIEEGGRVWLQPVISASARTRFTRFRGSADVGLSTDELLALTRADEAAETAPDYQP